MRTLYGTRTLQPYLAGADYSAINKILEVSLVRCTCGTEEIYGAVGGQELDLITLSDLNFAQMK